ncbi:hypothetical protein [Janthinobacterium agaricidamnosum]|uniref:Uncharacterized protein n=1 Tax=Janthinobacterium agaricidamnosum NBRC 102515 = DSM 9628 TaxID=1349767 RepID=W0V3I1_9BURK|nr:hypothetical protein [Janthinobacterium agaricidamnosum]CDG83389.1 hypothetical protein GJA_2758 [Janthinobacterium agaricidamnosum NBRC 102515 = DSM 9628]
MLTYEEVVAINMAIEPVKGGIAIGQMNAHKSNGEVDLKKAMSAVSGYGAAKQSAELALRIMFSQPFGDGNHRTAAAVIFANMLHHQIGVRRQYSEVLHNLNVADDSDGLPEPLVLQVKVRKLADYIGAITKPVPEYAHQARRDRLFQEIKATGDILSVVRGAQKDFFVSQGGIMTMDVSKREAYKEQYTKEQRNQIARCLRAMGYHTN